MLRLLIRNWRRCLSICAQEHLCAFRLLHYNCFRFDVLRRGARRQREGDKCSKGTRITVGGAMERRQTKSECHWKMSRGTELEIWRKLKILEIEKIICFEVKLTWRKSISSDSVALRKQKKKYHMTIHFFFSVSVFCENIVLVLVWSGMWMLGNSLCFSGISWSLPSWNVSYQIY